MVYLRKKEQIEKADEQTINNPPESKNLPPLWQKHKNYLYLPVQTGQCKEKLARWQSSLLASSSGRPNRR